MNDTVKKVLLIAGVGVLGVAVGRFTLPEKVVEKEKIVYQDRIVEKKVIVADTHKNDHKNYIKVEKTLPDGTKVVETRIISDSSSGSSTTIVDNKTEDRSQTNEKEKSVTNSKQNTLISLGVKVDLNQTNKLAYGLFVNQRVLGPLYMGAFGFTDKSFGLNVGLSF